MIVYGDLQRTATPADLIASLRSDVALLARLPDRDRYDASVGLLLAAGELAQGLLDAEFATAGHDDWTPLAELCSRATRAAADLVVRPESALQAVAEFDATFRALAGLRLPAAVTVKVPEGYAFYAVYPELYVSSARRFRAEHTDPVAVIGLRSIGTSLAAMVAAATESQVPPITLRPAGHPFARCVRLGERLRERIASLPRDTHFAIVDEGPGLSGSSLGAAADWLEEMSIPQDRISFFPGHAGDLGPQASDRHRERWRRARRHVTDFEELLLRHGLPSPAELQFEDGVSNADLVLEDVSAGRWRGKHYPSVDRWPPSNPTWERRKYLYSAEGRTWLAKFTGLGPYGDGLRRRAETLADAGLTPDVRGLRRGFLVQEWLSAAKPLDLVSIDRRQLIESVADYLAFLAREFPAGPDRRGAAPARLLEMAKHNAAACLGDAEAAVLTRWDAALGRLRDRTHPVLTDNRTHAWEWLLLPEGRLLKTDALEHHAAHDLIGPQDLAWDIVGATTEFSLSLHEREELIRQIAVKSRHRPDPFLLDFLTECYLAFQAGAYAMSAGMNTGNSAEAARLNSASRHYSSRLSEQLHRATARTTWTV